MKRLHSQAAEIAALGISAFESANGLSLPTCISHPLLLYSGPCSKRQWPFQTGFLRRIGRSTFEGRWVMGVRGCICSPSITSNEKVGSCDTTQCCPPSGCLGKFPLKCWGWGRGWSDNIRSVSGSLVKNPPPSRRRGLDPWVRKIPWRRK